MKYLLLLTSTANLPGTDTVWSAEHEAVIDSEPDEVKDCIENEKFSIDMKLREEYGFCYDVTVSLRQVVPLT